MKILETDSQGRPVKGFVEANWDDSQDRHLQSQPINWKVAIPAIILVTAAMIALPLWLAGH